MKLHITLENWKSELIQNIGSSNIGNIRKELYKRKDLHESIINETEFCAELTDINVRLTYIINRLSNMNHCVECNDLINDGGKKTFCSFSCRAKNQAKNSDIIKKRTESYSLSYSKKSDIEKEQIKNNRKKTLKEKYGVEHNFNIAGFKETRAQTWRKNYGITIAQQSPVVKAKAKETCNIKYGGNNPLSNPDIYKKWIDSFKRLHNTDNPMRVNEIKRKQTANRLGIHIDELVFVKDHLLSKEFLTFVEYRILVMIKSQESLMLFGDNKFGVGWQKTRGRYKKHVDHMLSIRNGYVNDVSSDTIAHIENLDLISCNENLSKGAKDSHTIYELENKIKLHNEKIKSN
jgi:hypothetical protein